jgi:hypothetical protein
VDAASYHLDLDIAYAVAKRLAVEQTDPFVDQ